jgi:hypothetical protein
MKSRFPQLLLPVALFAAFAGLSYGAERPTSGAIEVPASCPVTRNLDQTFVPPAPYPSVAPSANWVWLGAKELWVMSPADGIWRGITRSSPNGPITSNKQFWMSEGYSGTREPQPELIVSGRRLDGDAPPIAVGPATNARHSDFGGWAMLVGPGIPVGCWELTGQYRNRSVSFVVWVPGN